MLLTLSIKNHQGETTDSSEEYNFGSTGGSIGRGSKNDWTLPDQNNFLSKKHAIIEFNERHFYIIDNSTNGVFINYSRTALGRGNQHKITLADEILMGEYTLVVNQLDESVNIKGTPSTPLSEDSKEIPKSRVKLKPSTARYADPFDEIFSPQKEEKNTDEVKEVQNENQRDADANPSIAQEKQAKASTQPVMETFVTETPPKTKEKEKEKQVKASAQPVMKTFVTEALPKIQEKGKEKQAKASTQPVMKTSVTETPPKEKEKEKEKQQIKTEEERIPSTDPFADIAIPIPPKPQPVKVEKRTEPKAEAVNTAQKNQQKVEEKTPNSATNTTINTTDSNALTHILQSAGLSVEDTKKIPANTETYQLIGQVLKESLDGTMNLLRTRNAAKNHLNLDNTLIARQKNNPLKFLPNAQFVLQQTLTPENRDDTYLPLAEALCEAYNDISAHEYSMATSIQEALAITIKKHFEPKSLQKKLEKENPIISKIPLKREADLWQLFTSIYDEIAEEASECFQVLLDKEIVNAYEIQIKHLKEKR